MGRKRINIYDSTPFSRRICQLQEERGYTDQQVIEGVVDENGNPLITGEQAYKTHKTARITFKICLEAMRDSTVCP